MQVNVLLFAALREAADCDTITIEVAPTATAGDVLRSVAEAIPTVAGLIPSCRVALDSRYVTSTEPIQNANEIAIIPPVSGG
ncbi:ThiS family protein [Planctomycetes bacterium CA13]|uniref:Molybdopterin synthase sulfur carrier subunit n=1 Tax=Novipirellula herctigrandis TaxID=2527986 RepID=A0A5C5ZBV4_9BACT|nr:ThiS family protein [Planctomycetes bacterium CA13]